MSAARRGRLLVGFMGAKRSGKDTAAVQLRTLATLRQVAAHRRALADELKAEYVRETGLTLFALDAEKGKHRAGLQALGDRMRAVDEDVFIKRLVLPEDGLVTVTDVRRANEVAWVRAAGGVLVRVVRDVADAESLADPHITEHEWRSVEPDWWLHNNGTEMHLDREVRRLWRTLIRPRLEELGWCVRV